MNPAATARRALVWHDAQLALLALQLDPLGIGGVWLRCGHGPVRDAWLARLQASGIKLVKVPGQVDNERLLGGIDLTQTLQSGRLVQQQGLLAQADGGVVLLPMAERLPRQTLAPIVQTCDRGAGTGGSTQDPAHPRFAVVALDESEEDEPGLAPAMAERLGLWLDLHDLTHSDSGACIEPLSPQECSQARRLLTQLAASEAQIHALCETAMALGVHSVRAPLMALRVATVQAALDGRDTLEESDLATAARLVLGPRATCLPAPGPAAADSEPDPAQAAEAVEAETSASDAPDQPQEPTPAPHDSTEQNDPAQQAAEGQTPAQAATPAERPSEMPAETLVAAALASLPPRLLERLLMGQPGRTQAQASGNSGQTLGSKLRGRPLSPRPGRPGSGARLHLLATLRAAAPKQKLRSAPPGNCRVSLRAEDFHVQRFAQRSPSCLIFALDASGSAAMQRLAEAKGAVELLLHDSYARRDSVCVIAFRGTGAQQLLAPTRSLVRAKRSLAGLAGGGGTPLASALQAALLQARSLQRAGTTPMLVMLSDGRANVSGAGVGGRVQARADALALAAQWRTSGFASLWIDTAAQPEPQAQQLAQQMGAHYFPMPYVQAQRMASVVQSVAAQVRAA